jgi:hypothetical protein
MLSPLSAQEMEEGEAPSLEVAKITFYTSRPFAKPEKYGCKYISFEGKSKILKVLLDTPGFFSSNAYLF